jgi:hypothetical protein
MSARSQISVDNKKYTGEYELDHGVLHVFFEGQHRSSAVTGPNQELLARLLFIELIFQAPSWRDHPPVLPSVNRDTTGFLVHSCHKEPGMLMAKVFLTVLIIRNDRNVLDSPKAPSAIRTGTLR